MLPSTTCSLASHLVDSRAHSCSNTRIRRDLISSLRHQCACALLAPAASQVTCQQPDPTAAQAPDLAGFHQQPPPPVRMRACSTCSLSSRVSTASAPTAAQAPGPGGVSSAARATSPWMCPAGPCRFRFRQHGQGPRSCSRTWAQQPCSSLVWTLVFLLGDLRRGRGEPRTLQAGKRAFHKQGNSL